MLTAQYPITIIKAFHDVNVHLVSFSNLLFESYAIQDGFSDYGYDAVPTYRNFMVPIIYLI